MDIYNTKPRKIKCVRNDEDVWGGGGENHHLLEIGKEYIRRYYCSFLAHNCLYRRVPRYEI